jgi:hypothetical protein
MQYNQPFGVSDPNAPYINGNPSTGTQGSIPPAASIEYPQREIANLITDGGFTPTNNDLRQLGRSLQSGHIWYGLDTGVMNALQANLTPAPLAYYDGMAVWITAANTNNGPSTLQLNGLPATVIQRRGGGDVQSGDIVAGYKTLYVYSTLHSNFELYGINFSGIGYLPILTQNTNLYVNGTTGSDTLYDGSSATVVGAGSPKAGPFKTIGAAVNKTWTFGPSVYTMTINIAAGTYNEAVLTPAVVGPRAIFNGVGATTIVQAPSVGSKHTFMAQSSNQITIQNMRVLGPTSGSGGPSGFVATSGATLTTNNISMGSCPVGYVYDSLGGYIYPGTTTYDAGFTCLGVIVSFSGGVLVMQSGSVHTMNGTLTIQGGAGPFASSIASSIFSVPIPPAGTSPVFVNPGNVVGLKYTCSLNGVINTQGLGTSYFPGNSAGTLATGGQYG